MQGLQPLIRDATLLLDRSGIRHEGAELVEPTPGLTLLRHRAPTELSATVYDPVVCLILQGAKETWNAGRAVRLGAGSALVVSHVAPVLSRITQAAPHEPYLALVLRLELRVLRDLYDELARHAPNRPEASAFAAGEASLELVDAMGRYLGLARDPADGEVLGPVVLKEIHYRLLMSAQGEMLHRLVRYDSHEHAMSIAISRIRRDFKERLSVAELASEVHMSPSTFHEHFRRITGTTPLQFQKELRLQEAQRQLRAGEQTVAMVAVDVGYRSPNQFSREYLRRFGATPQSERARSLV